MLREDSNYLIDFPVGQAFGEPQPSALTRPSAISRPSRSSLNPHLKERNPSVTNLLDEFTDLMWFQDTRIMVLHEYMCFSSGAVR